MLTYITIYPYTAFLAGFIAGAVLMGAACLWEC